MIDVADEEYEGENQFLGSFEYEEWLAQGDASFEWQLPEDEWDAISLNYTSGTTGNPKGVVYHHRGAYLNAASNILACGMKPRAVYLWTLPLFTVMVGALHGVLQQVAEPIFVYVKLTQNW